MTDEYRAGAVWWVRIDFGQGRGPQEKFILLLTDCPSTGAYDLFAFVTSQARWYQGMSTAQCGCPKLSCYRIDPGQEACFKVPTFVQFGNMHPISRAGLDDFVRNGNAKFIQRIGEVRFRSVLKCATQSVDITGERLAMIKATLAALGSTSTATGKPTLAQAATAKTTQATAPLFLSVEVMHLKTQIAARCGPCRDEFAVLMDITVADLALILTGAKQPSADFTRNIDAGLDAAGPDCTCRLR